MASQLIRHVKEWVWQTPPYRWKARRAERRLEALREPYLPQIRQIVGEDTSIIGCNCFPGRIMQDLGMVYNTPTLGLYIWAPDFIELLSHLRYYMTEARLTFAPHSKYAIGDQRRAERDQWYPIGLLDEKVEVVFLHYHSEEEAAEKWHRRAARINWDRLLVVGMEQNLCTEQCIRDFDRLPFERKVFFSTRELPGLQSNCRIGEFEGEVGDPYRWAHLFYRELAARF